MKNKFHRPCTICWLSDPLDKWNSDAFHKFHPLSIQMKRSIEYVSFISLFTLYRLECIYLKLLELQHFFLTNSLIIVVVSSGSGQSMNLVLTTVSGRRDI